MIYLYCYDIADDRRLRRISKRLEQMGIRVQKSIFQCDAPRPVHQRIVRELRSEMNRRQDSLRVYPICQDCAAQIQTLGDEPAVERVEYKII